MWLWPSMVAGAAPVDGISGSVAPKAGSSKLREQGAVRAHNDAFCSIAAEFRHTSRRALLHITTTLSRNWDRLSRVFGQMRGAMACERLMHASLGWALTPLQRLMPSAIWPVFQPHMDHWGSATRGNRYMRGGDMSALGMAWWRMSAGPFLPNTAHGHANTLSANPALFALAPMFGVAAIMPAFGFALSH